MKSRKTMDSKSKSGSTFFVDTNVFIYAAGADHPLREPCAAILRSSLTRNLDLRTSVEVLQELLYRHLHVGQVDKGVEMCGEILTLLDPVLPVHPADLRLAMELLGRYPGIDSRDAVHAAVALNNGINQIVSSDRHFDRIKDIVRIDPAEIR